MASISPYQSAKGLRYRVRYTDADGKRTDKRGFHRKADAEAFLYEIQVELMDDDMRAQIKLVKSLAPPARTEQPGVRSRWISPKVRQAVIDRDGMVCQLCGVRVWIGARGKQWHARRLHLDHINEFRTGGLHSVENLRVTCAPCNISRSNRGRAPIS